MNAHSAWDIDGKVEELLASPAGCAFLIVLQESGVSAADAVHPGISLQAAYRAIDDLSIWRHDFQETVKYALLNGRKVSKLAHAILELPEVGWWFAPMDRTTQTWAASRHDAPTLPKFKPPIQATKRRAAEILGTAHEQIRVRHLHLHKFRGQ
ncbi:MAG: hypothetical protein F4Y44_01630 [Chloroflexi bacterium]|nr:hypothetical protein [Chloroflexota bacterium]